jgi:Uma2 family endonuclease
MSTKKEQTENQEKTPKKITKYEFSEEKDNKVEERPFMPLPALDLDLTKRYTYADYLTWFDDLRRELIDGFIHIMSAPWRLHQHISGDLLYFIRNYLVRNKGKCQVYVAPFDVRLPVDGSKDDDKIYNVVQPDICVVCDLSKLDDKGCIGAPDLVVEISSPSTLKKDWNYKFNLYEKAGVREYWIVNPKAKLVTVFLLQPDGFYGDGTEYSYPQKVPVHILDGLEIDLEELFSE